MRARRNVNAGLDDPAHSLSTSRQSTSVQQHEEVRGGLQAPDLERAHKILVHGREQLPVLLPHQGIVERLGHLVVRGLREVFLDGVPGYLIDGAILNRLPLLLRGLLLRLVRLRLVLTVLPVRSGFRVLLQVVVVQLLRKMKF